MTKQTSLELQNRSSALMSQLRSAASEAANDERHAEHMLLLDALKTAVDLNSRLAQICEATKEVGK